MHLRGPGAVKVVASEVSWQVQVQVREKESTCTWEVSQIDATERARLASVLDIYHLARSVTWA